MEIFAVEEKLDNDPGGRSGRTAIFVEDGARERSIVEDDDSAAHVIQIAHAGPCEKSPNQVVEPLALPAHHGPAWMRRVGQLAGCVEKRAATEVLDARELP